MATTVDKAIAAFLTSLVGMLAVFNIELEWLSPTLIATITPFVAFLITWLIPNKTA